MSSRLGNDFGLGSSAYVGPLAFRKSSQPPSSPVGRASFHPLSLSYFNPLHLTQQHFLRSKVLTLGSGSRGGISPFHLSVSGPVIPIGGKIMGCLCSSGQKEDAHVDQCPIYLRLHSHFFQSFTCECDVEFTMIQGLNKKSEVKLIMKSQIASQGT